MDAVVLGAAPEPPRSNFQFPPAALTFATSEEILIPANAESERAAEVSPLKSFLNFIIITFP